MVPLAVVFTRQSKLNFSQERRRTISLLSSALSCVARCEKLSPASAAANRHTSASEDMRITLMEIKAELAKNREHYDSSLDSVRSMLREIEAIMVKDRERAAGRA